MSETETIQFPVSGMTCGSCANRITRTVGTLDGVTRVTVDVRRETAMVRREPALVSNALAAAVRSAGYEAEMDAALILPTEATGSRLARLRYR